MTESINPSSVLTSVVKSDSVNFVQEVRQIYVGTGGDVVVVEQDNTAVTFKNVNSGTTIGPFYIKRVNSTGTTASDMIAFA